MSMRRERRVHRALSRLEERERPLVITSESTTRYVYTQIAETRGNLCERGRYPEGTKRKRNPGARAVCSIRKIRTVLCILARRYLLSQEYLAR